MNPPSYFTEAQLAVWRKLVASVNGKPPATTLEAYCVELCRWRDAERWLSENGAEIYIRDDKGVLKSVIPAPHLKIARDSAAAVQRLSKALRLRGEVA